MMNNNQQKTPGLNCPQCGAFIPTSIPRTALFKRTSLYALRSDTHYKPQRIETCDGDTEKRKRCTAKPEQGKFFPTINTIDYGRWT